MKYLKTHYLTLILSLSFLFAGLSAFADELPGDELELALNKFIDALKMGKTAVIIVAVVGLIRTRFVMKYLGPILEKIGFSFLLVKPEEQVKEQIVKEQTAILTGDVEGVNPGILDTKVLAPKISGKALPWVTVATGIAAGVGNGLITGKNLKQSIFEGVLSSGAAMGLFDLIVKTIKK